jgi:hypothetical protein
VPDLFKVGSTTRASRQMIIYHLFRSRKQSFFQVISDEFDHFLTGKFNGPIEIHRAIPPPAHLKEVFEDTAKLTR